MPYNYSTVNNMLIQDRTALCDYIERRLGSGLVRVELTAEMLGDAIDDATQLFTKYVTPEEEYIIIDKTAYIDDPGNNFEGYKMPLNVAGINGVSSQNRFRNFALQLDPGMNRIAGMGGMAGGLGSGHGAFGSPGVLATFHMAVAHLDLLRKLGGGEFQFQYNNANQELKIYPELKNEEKLVIMAQTFREESLVLGERFVKEYALACAMVTLGFVRGKMSQTTLIGGVTINTAEELIDKGEARKRELEEELKLTEYPVMQFYVQ